MTFLWLALWVVTTQPDAPPPAAAATSESAPEDVLRRAKNEYAYGNYLVAIEQLKGVMYPMRLSRDEQVLEARKYLALCYFLTDNSAAATEEFGKLLYIAPDYSLDPYTIAPPVIELFESVRLKMKPELDGIRQRKTDAELARPAPGTQRRVELTLTQRSDFATFMPFGTGQFQNGDNAWGVGFLTAELALLGVNIGAYFWAQSEGDFHISDDSKRAFVRKLTVAQYAAAALFGVTWSLGVLHARLNFIPVSRSAPVIRDEPLGGAAIVPELGLKF